MAQLAVVAAVSTLIYLLALAGPYNLFDLFQQPHLDLRQLSQAQPAMRWWLVAVLLIEGALYWRGWRLAQGLCSRVAWAVVLAGAAAMSGALIFVYPFEAADLFDNIMHGRILGVHGGDPFREVGNQFASDPFLPYMAWRYAPSAYGPGWELPAALVARIAGDHVVTNVIAFKLLVGAFLAGSAAMVVAILRRLAPGRTLAGVLWLTWNPVILYETMGHGHNDVAMVFWILVAIWALLCQRYTASILALVAGALVKYIPVLLVPAAGFVAWQGLGSARARFRFLVVTAVSASALIALTYGPFWDGLETLGIDRRTELFTTSLPATLYALIEARIGADQARTAIGRAAAALTFLFALWQGIRAGRQPSPWGFVRAVYNILLLYLLVTCLWFQPWYAVWPLAVAALLPPGPRAYLSLVLGYATLLAKQFIVGPMLLWIDPLPAKSWREVRLGPAVMAVPWLYSLFVIWNTRFRRTGR